MRLKLAILTMLAIASLACCTQSIGASGDPSSPRGPVHVVTREPGVIPPGTSLVVRTDDVIITDRAFGATTYGATIAEDMVDQNGKVLIPQGSSVDLSVFSFAFLGPGGAGMTELVLGFRAITVDGVNYPVETAAPPRSGGLGINEHVGEWVGGSSGGQVLTRGSRISVPSGALLSFKTNSPIRLNGYHR